MTSRKNKNRLSAETDKHLCTFLVSPFRLSGVKAYKIHYNIEFPETYKQISNRLEYLKKIYHKNHLEFAKICDSYGINSTDYPQDALPPITLPIIRPTAATTIKATAATPQTMSVSSSDSNPFGQAMRKHEYFLNFEFPSLNSNGMMWFRDDDVEIGDSMCSVLTIYQPLNDPRDHALINLRLDVDDPSVLHHIIPNVPTFMYRDFNKIHELERSEANPEVFTATKKKHKKHAFKIVDNKHLKLQRCEYRLPFSLTMDPFDGIVNSNNEIMKHYRTIDVVVDEERNIHHTCSFIFWKVLIEGETTNCSTKAQEFRNVYADAADRSRDPPGNSSYCNLYRRSVPFVGDVKEEKNAVVPEGPPRSDATVALIPTSPTSAPIPPRTSEASFATNPVLTQHLSRFFAPLEKGTESPQPTKKQKLNDSKPMDEDDISL